jgi:uncharacterized protein (DUF1800 family)
MRGAALVGRILVAAALAGCAGIEPVAANRGAGAGRSSTDPLPADTRVLHVLQRVTYGPRPGDLERVRAVGLATWLERQLHPERLDDSATEELLATLPTLAMSVADLHREYPRPRAEARAEASRQRAGLAALAADRRPVRIVGELQAAKMLRAVTSERQLQEVMVDFWFNHFNVFAGKGELRWYVTAYERDAVRPHALGHFPDLLRATAHHPAMLFYLDNWLSTGPDFVVRAGPSAGRRAGLNENYARELMELHTLGVDGGYTQADVTEVARAFTGWTIDRPRVDARFVFRPARHDGGDKVVLGRPVRGGGQRDGEEVLDLLAHHPATARFIAGKLVRRFVADDPPPALVERVALVYRETDGDIRAMLRTIFAAPEFLAADAVGAKIKKPSEFVASAARAVGATVNARGALALARASADIGEGLYQAQPPTGHPDRAEAWVNPGALLARMNFALSLVEGRLPGVQPDLSAMIGDERRKAPDAMLERLLAALLHGRATAATRDALRDQLAATATSDAGGATSPEADVARLTALVLGSPEFQRR